MRLRLVIVVAVILGGCGSDETSDASASLPHHDGGTPAEGFEGVLRDDGGCIRVTLEGIGDYPALWPPAWRIADDGNAVSAVDGTRLEFGEPVGLGGGIGGAGTGTGSLPEACSGDEVFFVGEVIR